MTTIRVAKRKRFTTTSREPINDERLSFRARGVLWWLLDKPDDWQTNSRKIAEAGKEGRNAIRAALNELEALGYIVRTRSRDRLTGKWLHEMTVYEEPVASVTTGDGFPGPGFPAPVSGAIKERLRLKTDTPPTPPEGGDQESEDVEDEPLPAGGQLEMARRLRLVHFQNGDA